MNYSLIGLVATGLALVLSIVSTSIPYWYRASINYPTKISRNVGLFQVCVNSVAESSCYTYYGLNISIPYWLVVTQAVMIVSVLSLAASLFLSVVYAFVKGDNRGFSVGAGITSYVGGVFCCIGFVTFGAKYTSSYGGDPQGGLHASFGLAVLSTIIALISGLVHSKSKPRQYYSYTMLTALQDESV